MAEEGCRSIWRQRRRSVWILGVSLDQWTRLTVGTVNDTVRVYEWKTDTEWVRVSVDISAESAGDAAGFAVSMAGDGSRVAIGAPQSDANGTDSGHVRVYVLAKWDATAPPASLQPSSPPPPPLPPPRRVLLHHRPLRSNGIRWVQISMAIPATIMAGRSLCLGMACGWQSDTEA